ncbi:MAG TPA: transcriptional regulator [Chloroflexota bacterium]|nr:transcriptional regulator [Chloroflexota bacterium]
MTLGEKLQHLRQLEGELRGLGRPMTKAEVLRAMRAELGEAVSHAYLCQLESGARTHMSPATRALMARFFKVLPGYLVSDPEGYQAAIVSDVVTEPDALRSWLAARAEEVRDDLHLYHVLLKMSRHPDPRRLFDALEELVDAEQPASKRSA